MFCFKFYGIVISTLHYPWILWVAKRDRLSQYLIANLHFLMDLCFYTLLYMFILDGFRDLNGKT